MDIIREIGNCQSYNLHSHTQYCDGRASMEEFVRIAIDIGFTHYGFSPHSPIPIESTCNMKKNHVPLYIEEFNRLKSIYSSAIKLYLSMEIDYIGEEWGPSHPYFDTLPLDYRIGSVHFIPAKDGTLVDIDGSAENFKRKMEIYFENDIKYVVDKFYSQSKEMIQKGGFDIIGHFDKIGYNASQYQPEIENKKWYQQHINEMIDVIKSKNIIVELNTKAMEAFGRMFPNQRYLSRIVQENIPIVINSDAHYPHLINASRNNAFELLYNCLAF